MAPGRGLPHVRLYKIGDACLVSDGHHRVSIASYHGNGWIDARVTEFCESSAPKSIPAMLSDVQMHDGAYPLPEGVAVEVGRTLRLALASSGGRSSLEDEPGALKPDVSSGGALPRNHPGKTDAFCA